MDATPLTTEGISDVGPPMKRQFVGNDPRCSRTSHDQPFGVHEPPHDGGKYPRLAISTVPLMLLHHHAVLARHTPRRQMHLAVPQQPVRFANRRQRRRHGYAWGEPPAELAPLRVALPLR